MHSFIQQIYWLSFIIHVAPLSAAGEVYDRDNLQRLTGELPRRQGPSRVHVGGVPYGPIINSCYLPGTVALTFDDGPSTFTPHVLDLLDQHHARATFFVNGDNFARGEIDDPATQWPDVLRRMHRSGHQIGSHTWSHADLTHLGSEARHWQVTRLETSLAGILDFYPTYLRPPFASCDGACQADMAGLGYHVVNFNVDTKDYEHDSPSAVQASIDNFAWAVTGDPATASYMVLSHDVYEQTTHTLLRFMLETIDEKGFRAVTVGECLGDPAENWYRTA